MLPDDCQKVTALCVNSRPFVVDLNSHDTWVIRGLKCIHLFRQIERMNVRHRIATQLAVGFLLLCFPDIWDALGAEAGAGTAKVQSILGRAQFSRGSGPFVPLGPGMVLHAGDLVQTATGSAVDLYLGEIPG